MVFHAGTNGIQVSNTTVPPLKFRSVHSFAQVERLAKVAGVAPVHKTVQQVAGIGRVGPGIVNSTNKLGDDNKGQVVVTRRRYNPPPCY